MYKAKVYVSYKDEILDPAGSAVTDSLHSLGWPEASNVRIGKYITLDVEANGGEEAKRKVSEMSHKLLSNPIIEKFEVEILEKISV